MVSILRRLLAYVRRDRLDDDVAEEVRLHLELRKQALIESGMTPADADREARRQFGNVTLIRERVRDQWGGSSIDMLIHDVRYGLRLIRKAPGFSAVAIASVALAIGASTVVFSFANSFLFRPLHAADPDRLVQIFTSSSSGNPYSGSSYADYEAFREVPAFSGVLASMRAKGTLSDEERPDVIAGLLVSGNYFDVLGLRPSRGRFFAPEESHTPGTHPVMVLSHDAWRRRFGSDPAIVGRVIELSGHPFTVIGVGPPRFTGTSIEYAAEFFVPAMMQAVVSPGPDMLRNRQARGFHILGRLRPGATVREADAALQVVAAQLLQEDPEAWRDQSGRSRVVTALPEMTARFADAGPGSVAFIFSSVIASVVALLAIACINVATVLLARATTRRKEIAIRLAIGASRRRLVRQLLTECALLAAAGGALGLMIAQVVAALFGRLRPAEVPPFDLTLDYRILGFSICASLVTVVFFGLAPALQTTRPDVNAELKDAARAIRIRGFRFGLRNGLVVIQVALSLALMIGAALLLRSSHAGRTEDPGFRRDGVLSIGIDLSAVPNRAGAHARFYQEAVRSVAAAAIAAGALELALSVMALYGVIAFAASQRRREIGLRMALGASNRSVIALMMREGLVMATAGIIAGVAIALPGGAALRSMLIGIGPADPVSFGCALLVLLLVTSAASYIPARSALSVDPSTALRTE
jgi:predicted permease